MGDYGDDLTAALANELRRRRLGRNWSLSQLAEASQVHRSSIHLIEAGRRGVSVAMAARLAAAFDVRLSDLISAAERALTPRK